MKLHEVLMCLVYCAVGEAVTSLYFMNSVAENVENIERNVCTQQRLFKMVGYVCSNLELKEIPQHLRSSVEVLDISFNRIRALNKKSFSRYTDIKYLYLFENMIQIIEANTFSQLTSLESIDLSANGLTTLPMELFSLPSLRNIHASDNFLVNLDADLMIVSKPLTAPLLSINIANNELKRVPDFGVLPNLWKLNISSNDLLDITPQQLSPFCSLSKVDVKNTKIPPCPCHALRHYFNRRSIAVKNELKCDASAEELINCPDVSISTVDSESYWYCKSLKEEKKMLEK